MAHQLTERERSRIWEAFTNWDFTGEGTILARDMCKVLEFLGEAPSNDLKLLSDRPDAVDEHVNFEEFLIMTVGPPWGASGHDYREELGERFAAIADSNGYVPLRDLMSALHEYMEDMGRDLTDDELLDIYRHALDVSFFETVGGTLAPEAMWKIFDDEFADLRKGRGTEHLAPSDSGQSIRAGTDGESASETVHMVNFTVVDLSGKQLMFDVVASTWSVQELQQHIEAVVGLPIRRQILCLAQDGLKHELGPKNFCLSKAGVSDGSTLLLVMKDEAKLDYDRFLAKLFDGEFDAGA